MDALPPAVALAAAAHSSTIPQAASLTEAAATQPATQPASAAAAAATPVATIATAGASVHFRERARARLHQRWRRHAACE